jgi:RNA polymerase sigma factor (TIGR02999 family)
MGDVTRLLDQCGLGDAKAADELLPLVYEELRRLAAARMAHERPDHTLGATALVHEAYIRLCGSENPSDWNGRGHFFGAAAEAMRRILVESARRKARDCHGGSFQRQDLKADGVASPLPSDDIVALSDALDRLSMVNSVASELVKLRFFAGLTNEEAAAAINVSPRKANQIWLYAKAWLLESLDRQTS